MDVSMKIFYNLASPKSKSSLWTWPLNSTDNIFYLWERS